MSIKYYFLLFVTCFCYNISFTQNINATNFNQLKKLEAAIQVSGFNMINKEEDYDRFAADSVFIRGFVQALKTPQSFYYPFDSLQTISKLYAPDSSFRIFTWQIMKDFTYYRQRGAIQMLTADGSLKLFPLIDVSDDTEQPNDSIRSNNRWIGAIYYKVLQNMAGNKKVYTLLGFDENNAISNKKWIETLTFNEEGKPFFGGRYFQYTADAVKPKQPAFRFSLEYKKEAKIRVNFDEEAGMIIFDHLISESNEEKNKSTLIPDGSYEGFKWAGGRWAHVDKLTQLNLGDGKAPLEDGLFAEDGTINQKKINEQNKKTLKQNPQKTVPKKEDKYRVNDKNQKPQASKEKVDY